MKKYIVLDVDGVLNSNLPTEDSFTAIGVVQGSNYRLNLNKNHTKWLINLAADTNSELIWGTAWMHHANSQIGKKIGLPELVCPDYVPPKFSESAESWKSRIVLSYVKDNFFVWFDDMPYISNFLENSKGHLIVCNPATGLTLGDINVARNILMDFEKDIR